MTTATFYPALDGRVAKTDTGDLWTTLVTANGNLNEANAKGTTYCETQVPTGFQYWVSLYRGYVSFDTSSLGAVNITSATLSLYGYNKQDPLGITPDICVYGESAADGAGGKYEGAGSVAFSTPITYANWSTTGYNDFVLNYAGRSNIKKTGTSLFSVRNACYDAANVAPPYTVNGNASLISYRAKADGGDLRPKLVVTYTDAFNNIVSGIRHIYNRQSYNLELTFGGVSVTEPIVNDELTRMADEAVAAAWAGDQYLFDKPTGMDNFSYLPPPPFTFGGGESGGAGASRSWTDTSKTMTSTTHHEIFHIQTGTTAHTIPKIQTGTTSHVKPPGWKIPPKRGPNISLD